MVEIDTALVINHDVHEPVLTFESQVGKDTGVFSVANRDYRDLETDPLSQIHTLISYILLRRRHATSLTHYNYYNSYNKLEAFSLYQ